MKIVDSKSHGLVIVGFRQSNFNCPSARSQNIFVGKTMGRVVSHNRNPISFPIGFILLDEFQYFAAFAHVSMPAAIILTK